MNNKIRRCCVHDDDGYFHGWFEKDYLILKFDQIVIRKSEMHYIREEYERIGVLPSCCSTEKLCGMFGLVEFEDGHVEEVKPIDIRFTEDTPI